MAGGFRHGVPFLRGDFAPFSISPGYVWGKHCFHLLLLGFSTPFYQLFHPSCIVSIETSFLPFQIFSQTLTEITELLGATFKSSY